jgi:hypothetical protein
MARSTKTVDWFELGYWTTDEDGKNVEWHVIGRYDTRELADEDVVKAQQNYLGRTFFVRMKRIEVVTAA